MAAPELRHRTPPTVTLSGAPLAGTPLLTDGSVQAVAVPVAPARPGDDDGPRPGDESGVDIAFLQCDIGAIVAIEQQREGCVALDREDGERGQSFGVGLEAVQVHAFAGQLLAQEAAELLVADAGQERRAQAESGRADGDVRRTASDRFGE